MKPGYRSIIVIIVGVLVIVIATVYVLLYWENLNPVDKDEDEDENSDFVVLNQQRIQLLRNEVSQELKSFKMKKILQRRDLVLRKENFSNESQISYYQKYVTPNNLTVKTYQTSNGLTTAEKIYAAAVKWTWVSDQTLHGKSEWWLYPSQFIQDTPTDPDNPANGMASDCESQACTLVSILEALGTQKSNVRVVVGEVNFSGEIGGHAWVQLYENGNWFELEATSGPFWDDDDQKLVNNIGFSFSYFKTHPYPVVEYWAFFNDQYYYNPNNNKKSNNLPVWWFETD